MRCSVLVIGAGPVGLTAAMDLAWRGIDVTVVELRHRGEPPQASTTISPGLRSSISAISSSYGFSFGSMW